jgi:hypothetical protein
MDGSLEGIHARFCRTKSVAHLPKIPLLARASSQLPHTGRNIEPSRKERDPHFAVGPEYVRLDPIPPTVFPTELNP